ncbi:hypothetical protein VP01_2416g3 [Puccinia sorghi]|uniref:Reverse transcriptase domain-containing protein n=1 Tax=Puccinia sorghi TaxID=27349 RepID=A0A0L6V791_9BASI|nr:hypothetical protein VP01_2416g3 [Puccinia sorghi]
MSPGIRYLARTGDGLAFQAFKFTKAKQPSMVDPLCREDSSLSSEMEEQSRILLARTSIINNESVGEILKNCAETLTPFLTALFNSYLQRGYFPRAWRQATMAIIFKADKPDYSEPNDYQPISLLCMLGKLLEKILNERLIYWIKNRNVLPKGHMGVDMQKIQGSFCLLLHPAPKVIQPSFDAQSLCSLILHRQTCGV